MTTLSDPLADYFRAIEEFDPERASDVVLELLDHGTPVDRITQQVLAPAQVQVGQLWESGTWSVADEHVATSITEGALAALTQAAMPRLAAHPRHVAVACAEGEWHSLPARMAATIAGATGEARVTMLGPSLSAEHLRHRLSAGDVDLLALSCTMPTNLVGAARCVAAAHDVDVPVIVGGRAFGRTPHRAQAIGADGWATDPKALLGPAPPRVRRSVEVSAEVLLLDAADEAIITLARSRLEEAFPQVAGMAAYQPGHAVEGLRWLSRFSASAVLTNDVTILEDVMTWVCALLRGMVPAGVLLTCAQLLADALAPHAPAGTALLRSAAAKVSSAITATGVAPRSRALPDSRSD